MEAKPILSLALDVDAGAGSRQPVERPVYERPAPPPAADPVDLRLVIEEDASGLFVYKTVDRRTGEVVAQLPREQLLRRREAADYMSGEVIRTGA